jgi:hypothetical protein
MSFIEPSSSLCELQIQSSYSSRGRMNEEGWDISDIEVRQQTWKEDSNNNDDLQVVPNDVTFI